MLYEERVRESLYTLDLWAIPKFLYTFLCFLILFNQNKTISVHIYTCIHTYIYTHTQNTHTYIYAHIYIMHMYAYCCLLARSCLTLCDPMDYSKPGFPVLFHLPEFAQTHVYWVLMSPNHLILCCPLPLLPSIFPRIRVFSNDLALCIRWPKYWSFNFSISPSSEYSGLISFRIDWFNLLTVQGSLKSLSAPQFEGINSLMFSILYGPILTSLHHYWKHHSFDYLDLCQKSDISLLFNTLSRFFIAFLPRSKHLLISWLQSLCAVILEPKKIKSATVSTLSPSISHEVMNLMPWSSFFECWVLSQSFHSHICAHIHNTYLCIYYIYIYINKNIYCKATTKE